MSISRNRKVIAGFTAAASAVALFQLAAPASADGVTFWRPPPVCAPYSQGKGDLAGEWAYVSTQYEYPVIAYNFIYILEYDPSPMEACYVNVA